MTSRSAFMCSVVPVLIGCASTPPDPNRPPAPACDQSVNCFYERNIRSFQVLDNRTVIVLVGRNECPFKLELDGFFCDLSMSAFLAFNDPDGRICTWDRTLVASGPFAREDEVCRVQQITPMNDDELLEAYAISGRVPPLPAKGAGEVEVVEEDEATPEQRPEQPDQRGSRDEAEKTDSGDSGAASIEDSALP